ncbi:MAG: hypothetical protein GX771_03560 [Halomonadaceae bacterium]|nr:hypothetical protein [Halomonadaceae bacterium]
MSGLLLAAVLLWPLLLVAGQVLRHTLWQGLAQGGRYPELLNWAWLSAPLPALLLALWPGELQLVMEGWLLGGIWQLEEVRRPWLAFSALLWLLATFYARGYFADERLAAARGAGEARRRLYLFTLLWPLTFCGNMLLLLAEDIPSFYLGFAIMTFAAYALVVHSGSSSAHHGGFVYLVMALAGEGLILGGLLWSAGSTDGITLTALRETIAEADQGLWMAGLLWLGFGVKAGVFGLHVWLPLAHPVAPTPASAVLSGVMVKAGIIGWLSTLPLGHVDAGLAPLGQAITLMGLFGAFAAALLGVAQRQPKAVLAYSSVSQLGMLASLVGMGLSSPAQWPALLAALTLFAAHHGLTKGALFLGVGISEHPPRLPLWLVWLLLVLPALSLSGVLASGLVAKHGMKEALYAGGHSMLVTWLSPAAVGSTLLMSRALWLQWRERGARALTWRFSMPLAWLITVLAALTLPWWLPLGESGTAWPPLQEFPALVWPAALGLAIAGLVWGTSRQAAYHKWLAGGWLRQGDLWWGYAALARRVMTAMRAQGGRLGTRVQRVRQRLRGDERRGMRKLDGVTRIEQFFIRFNAPLMVGLALLLLLGLWLG